MNARKLDYEPITYPNRLELVMSEPIEWIPAKEAAAIMNVAVSNVRYLCAEKRIRCQKFGRMWQVSKQDAEDYVRSNRNPEWLYEDDKNL